MDGALLKCSDDLTEFVRVEDCEAELCDEQAGKCNECVPSSTECADTTLLTCSPEGTGPTEEPCADPTPFCAAGKCVQCTSDEDCTPSAECVTAVCNQGTGMCEDGPAAEARTSCGDGMICGYLGNCVECLANEDCPGTQACSLLLTCTDLPPLQITPPSFLFPGTFTLTLNAGYKLRLASIDAGDEGGQITISEGLSSRATITASSRPGDLIAKGTEARTFTISGPSAASCSSSVDSEFQVTISFEATAEETDCDSFVITLEAEE